MASKLTAFPFFLVMGSSLNEGMRISWQVILLKSVKFDVKPNYKSLKSQDSAKYNRKGTKQTKKNNKRDIFYFFVISVPSR